MSSNVGLPPGLAPLVHNVELNRAGWWEKAVDQLIMATFWLTGRKLTLEELQAELETSFCVRISSGKLGTQVTALCSSSSLVLLADGKLKPIWAAAPPGLGFLLLAWLASQRGARSVFVSDWVVFQGFVRVKNWLFALVFGSIPGGLAARALWEAAASLAQPKIP